MVRTARARPLPLSVTREAWWRRLDPARLGTMLVALWLLFRHPDTPWLAKAVAIAVVAYAVSPIDLIPDFIPLLGQLDDVLLLPLGIALAVWLAPRPLWDACLADAQARASQLPRLWAGAVAIVVVWVVGLAALAAWLWHLGAGGST